MQPADKSLSNGTNHAAHTSSCTCLQWRPAGSAARAERQHSAVDTAFNERPTLAVGHRSGAVTVWEYRESHRQWVQLSCFSGSAAADPVEDIAWAPNMGRAQEYIATAVGPVVSIWQLDALDDAADASAPCVRSRCVFWHAKHGGFVHQVEWDLLGITLASSGSDGNIYMCTSR
eukprot:scaffold280_cov353-Prasinococcus_capsulatus_cf.AAC.6